MERKAVHDLALAALGELAPEVDLERVRGDDLIQDALDLDSFDFLTFVQRLHDATGVDVPEIDYPQIATLDGVVDYVVMRAA
jgi:acyl carrier protein